MECVLIPTCITERDYAVGSRQLRQFARVHPIRLVAVLEQAVLARVADDDLNLRLVKHVVELGGVRALLEGDL